MTREEIKDLLKFIIRKCDLVINNKNYTADEYAQDKIEDIAEMCHRVLDGQFGEIIEPSLPSDINDAAIDAAQLDMQDRQIMEATNDERLRYSRIFRRGFKAGAEWLAGQGVTKEAVIGMATEEISINVSQETLNELDLCPGDKVVVQIRKK